ncbi:PucR family transcriptional regulator [Cryptosporangium sp. NPDC048952]|uniref:PucR family transcriptional regulator n=1 Tax=Cryptosporangium sp. NPDC048952 TaxID=3363961 RepID=UPI003724692A
MTSSAAQTARYNTTLADLLAEPALDLHCAYDAGRRDGTVRWAHTTELLDPSPYLTGGELVCTVGTAFTDDDAVRRFVASVSAVGASGICFGAGDVHVSVPDALLDACREHALPLLVAPLGRPFMAISEWVADRRAGEAHARTDALTAELLAGLRRHQPVEVLLETCTTRLGGEFTLHEDGAAALPVPPGAAPVAPLAACDAAEVAAAAASVEGLTLRWNGPGPAPEASFLTTLVRLIAVARHERDIETDLRRERTGELVTLVAERLAAPIALSPLVHAAGLTPDDLVFSIWPSGAVRLLAASLGSETALLGETPTTAFVVTSSVALLRRGSDELGLPCGYSRSVPLADSSRALTEARAAFDLAQRHGGAVGPEGLTTLEGLLAQQPPDRLAPFVDRLLEPLLRSDRDRRTHYVPTLRAFLAHNVSLIETARAQFLHVNTVRHRLERIRELTGCDPFHAGERTDLVIALWAHDH